MLLKIYLGFERSLGVAVALLVVPLGVSVLLLGVTSVKLTGAVGSL